MRRSLVVIALLLPLLAIALVVGDLRHARADLENQIFTSKGDQLRIVVPRGWRATEQPSYPGILLWMTRAQPDAHIVLTAEAFTRKQYCSWPIQCRTSHDALPTKLACALRSQLDAAAHQQQRALHVGPIQAGPKENEVNGLPSVWFEYDDGKHYFRQAVALTEDRVISVLLSTSSPDARLSYVRAFESALRTLRPLTLEEAVAAGGPAVPPPDGAIVATPHGDGGPIDAGILPDAAVATLAGSGAFQSPPAAKINPVGSCAQ